MTSATATAPRRPLFVSHTAAPGGSNEVLLALLAHRPETVSPACVFLAPGATEERAQALGAATAVVATGRGRHVWRAPGVVGALRAAIRTHAADLVFGHTAKAHLYASIAAHLEGVPYLWWQHALPGQAPLLDRATDRLPASAVVVYSDFTAALQRARTPKVPVHRIPGGTVVPDESELVRADRPLVGIVGRLQRWKRVELVLRAVPAVLQSVPEARFVVVGGGDPAVDPSYPAELHALVARLGIGDAVEFTGQVTDAPDRIGRMAILAHAADREPFGLIYLEAMVREVPVVAPATGGSAEIVRDDVDGLLVEVEDPSALAAAIVALLRDPIRRAAMGAAGRARVSEHYDVRRMANDAWSLAASVARREQGVGRR